MDFFATFLSMVKLQLGEGAGPRGPSPLAMPMLQ